MSSLSYIDYEYLTMDIGIFCTKLEKALIIAVMKYLQILTVSE